jgi:multidrug efflux pump subunit AcrB
MWIVTLALRRPYTFVVAAIALVLLGIVTIRRMATDVFPEIDIPVVSVIWSYNGISAEEMERKILMLSERAMTTTVNGIEHIESTSLNGVGAIRLYFQPGAKIEAAVAQVTAINQTLLRIMPPGTTPPLIIRYSASNVPILQAALGSKTLSEQSLYDIGLNFIRTRLATVQGAQVPLPYGGKARQVMVDLDPASLAAHGLSPADVSAALSTQNVMLPGGTARLGDTEYNVRTNSSPEALAELAEVPIRQTKDRTVLLKDVADVRDGFAPQQSMVHVDGARSALLTVLKSAGASTLDIVARVKETLPKILATVPPGVTVRLLFDQSVFVSAAIDGVVREAAIAGGLTALMILIFLGSWRSTLIIALSIPLSMIVSLLCLHACGYTINTMTLGGLGLAVGVLVDDATVEIENIHRNLAMKKPLVRAILDGAGQIAMPAFVSTLAICIVFVPVLFITGAARFLFIPLSLAVIFAMLASYLLSRTLVPTMVHHLLGPEVEIHAHGRRGFGPLWLVHRLFNAAFERLRSAYELVLAWVLGHRSASLIAFVAILGAGAWLVPQVGRDFFPKVDAGQFRLHVRCPPGTRIEASERYFLEVERLIREVIPASDLDLVLDNIGVPPGGVNLAFSDSSTVSVADGEILVSLTRGRSRTAGEYAAALRPKLATAFPELSFFFQSADIVSQILNFGVAAPIDVQVQTSSRVDGLRIARELRDRIAKVPGAVDVRLSQVPAGPELRVTVDRTRASQLGLSQRDAASSLLTSLSGSGQASPTYWLNPANGVNYLISVQTPAFRIGGLADLSTTPLTTPGGSRFDLLESVADIRRSVAPVSISHHNVQPVYDVLLDAQGVDLGRVGAQVERLVAEAREAAPKGVTITVRGQYQSMNESFEGLAYGLLAAVVLVYCLLAVNFQSWVDPFIIILAVPGALVGVVVMLLLTSTTLSVPSLMGAIMCVGVATANSILLVSFANEQRREGMDAVRAAFSAGSTRLRPVLMTAAAMIIGMVPMSLGLGEGGEQNAPLGRAVIGGLIVATLATLLVVPAAYCVLRRRPPTTTLDPELHS